MGEKQGKLDFEHKMRLSGAAFVATLFILAEASPQGINFGGSTSSEKEEDIANRNYGQQSAPQIQQHQSQQCCCIPQQSSGRWVQGCSETSVYGNQQCGTRTYR